MSWIKVLVAIWGVSALIVIAFYVSAARANRPRDS